jgi:predicted TIM-barrel fold metal-dependent hydrolase
VKGAKTIDRVVCLALAPAYDVHGTERKDRSSLWVSNEYVKKVCRDTGGKALYGASVHPYDPDFTTSVQRCIDDGAVLLKWLPSAQWIDLADGRVRKALEFLATTKIGRKGHPLPLLLHVGPEHAIPTTDPSTTSYDYLSWSAMDAFLNRLRFRNRWHVPDIRRIHDTLTAGIDAGAVIILAHCGLPYFAANIVGRMAEHSDLNIVRTFVTETYRRNATGTKGKIFADVSACCTPMRKLYFDELRSLPPERLLFGSDFPTPAFELSAGRDEFREDFAAVMRGEIDRIVIPEENLLDVNRRELTIAFGNGPMFTNFSSLID